MSHIEDVTLAINRKYFTHTANNTYVRILDTPDVWGQSFGPEIMDRARVRAKEFRTAVEGIIQRTRFRCDVASLNAPDADWAKWIMMAMNIALRAPRTPAQPALQFRFLFGKTPLALTSGGENPNLTNFKGQISRFTREQRRRWNGK